MSSTPGRTPPRLEPVPTLGALANLQRWQYLALLGDGQPRSASEVARHFHRDFDGVSKHLRLLRKAGLLTSRRGSDRRTELFHLPAAFRPADGVLDLGFALFRIPDIRTGDLPPEEPLIAPVPVPEPAAPPVEPPAPVSRPQPEPRPAEPPRPPRPALSPIAIRTLFQPPDPLDDEPADWDDEDPDDEPMPGFGEMLTRQMPPGGGNPKK